MIKQAVPPKVALLNRLGLQFNRTNPRRLDLVIITHDDQFLTNRLQQAFAENSLAMIALPQSEWCFDSEWVESLMCLLLKEFCVRRILLVGHSLGVGSSRLNVSHRRSERYSKRNTECCDSNGELASVPTLRPNEASFVQSLTCLKSLPAFQSKFLTSMRFVEGFFYRASSDKFSYYDVATQSFRDLQLEKIRTSTEVSPLRGGPCS